jgi:hypothetical protein
MTRNQKEQNQYDSYRKEVSISGVFLSLNGRQSIKLAQIK